MPARARTVVELDAPHLVMQTHPAVVVEVIVEAIADVQRISIGKGIPTG